MRSFADMEISYESDRFKFVGRGNSLENPAALSHPGPLNNSEGSVLDPIVAIRYTFRVEPRTSVTVDGLTGIGDSQTSAQQLINKYQDLHMRDRVFELAFTHAQVVLRQINATEAEAQLYNRLASPVIYANSFLRAAQTTLLKNQKGQNGLWSYSISGDIPIVLLQISDPAKIELAKQLILARSYWALKGLITDLVILNEDPSGYRQVLQEHIQGLIAANLSLSSVENKGGIYTRSSDQMPAEDLVLLETVARVIVTDSRGSLTDQLNKRGGSKLNPPKNIFAKKSEFNSNGLSTPVGLELFNGLGGFTPDGKEYIIFTAKEQRTPLPWCNVIANKNFGTVVTESGSSYTWAENAHSYRLTPWHNDPVKDIQGEAVYIKDMETGGFWSPSPLPARGKTPYITRHGFGYTVFEHLEDGIYSELTLFVDTEASIKFMTLKVKNQSNRFRKLSATGYVEWVLGSIRARTGMHTVTEKELNSGALTARNSYNMEFNNHVSFLHTDEINTNFTTDRTEFIGRNGTLANPLGLNNLHLSGKTGAGMDACAAIQVPFELEHGHEKEITFKLGAAKNMQDANALIQQFKGRPTILNAQTKVHAFWTTTLSGVQIHTPDKALNILANGWLLYQVLSSRLWGRSGFYQSGGAYGFRDQLQDVMSLVHADPALTRKQILLSASRQFPEGDVQHWWHPPLGRGVRTLCSDDYLWLPFATARYVNLTGDTGVLDESATFISGRQLNAHEESYYDLPITLDEKATLYEHCKRAVIHGLRYGAHGLPLMGAGDWNDGMNMVGIEGKGESVWLAWFVYDVLIRFSKIAENRGDKVFADKCLLEADKLKQNINKHAWDGDWYIRAYFDDGTPLGSSKNTECRIDAISQSWSVLSEAGDKEHSLKAMESVNKHLVNRQKHLIQLLDPPFDKSDPDPGYIRGYVPGVRENGGQYTHAAIWTVMAYAKLGRQDLTWELLQLINPLNHGRTATEVATYKAEPYVMAADVYGVTPHTGRGGWTWYTGSAGWMYMLILESFLGLKREGEHIHFSPCIPPDWKGFTMSYRYHATNYTFKVECVQAESEAGILVDGNLVSENKFKLVDDQKEHVVQVNYYK
jgi:cyclic beta-1,2-glucan synthetase